MVPRPGRPWAHAVPLRGGEGGPSKPGPVPPLVPVALSMASLTLPQETPREQVPQSGELFPWGERVRPDSVTVWEPGSCLPRSVSQATLGVCQVHPNQGLPVLNYDLTSLAQPWAKGVGTAPLLLPTAA